MNRFWTEIIEPLIDSVKPRVIVEVGSDTGVNTERLLRFAARADAVVHVIDPLPKYDAEQWCRQWGTRLVFHRDLSLNVLGTIERMDCVLLDGDHNWYTVRNELGLIHRQCVAAGHAFPLVLLHDVGWPYGRRDLYYSPESIPEAFRQPYANAGMHPDHVELIPRGGMNAQLYNATMEGTARNGVRTAVDDFIADQAEDYVFKVIPIFFGLGILFRQRDHSTGELARTLAEFAVSPAMEALMVRVEAERVMLTMRSQEQIHRFDNMQQRLLELTRALGNEQAAMAELSNLLACSREQNAATRQSVEQTLGSNQAAMAELSNWLDEARAQSAATKAQLQAWLDSPMGRISQRIRALRTPRAANK
jgi:hypothetical protein